MESVRERFAIWEAVRQGLKVAVEDLTEEDLGWQPPNGAMNIHRLLRHLITVEEFFVQAVLQGGGFTPRTYELLPTKQAILDDMDRVHGRTLAYLDGLSPADLQRTVEVTHGPLAGKRRRVGDILYNVIDHECHHRGQIVLIRRLMGKPCERFVNALAFLEP